jgi:hypothetical protein
MTCDNCQRTRKAEDLIRSAWTGRHYCKTGIVRCDELAAARQRKEARLARASQATT